MTKNACIRCGGALVDTGIFCPACRAEEDRKTDDARIARLTVLARKWLHSLHARVEADDWHGEFFDVRVLDSGERGDVIRLEIPNVLPDDLARVLDALEAALLVLDLSPQRAARLLHGMRTYRECPCVRCERDRALASEKKC